jgi:hypothetical protein
MRIGVAVGAVVVILSVTACSASGDEEVGAAPTEAPGSTASSQGPPPPFVSSEEVFLPIEGVRFTKLSASVRAKTQRAFRELFGDQRFEVAVRGAHLDDEKRPGTVMAISVEVPAAELVDDFQDAAVDGMIEIAPSTEIDLDGSPAYISESINDRGLRRIFFFYKETVLVQAFAPTDSILKLLATEILAHAA